MGLEGRDYPVASGRTDIVRGRWQGGNAGNCTRLEGTGINSVVIGTTGLYTITLRDRYVSLISHGLSIGGTDGTAADMKVVNAMAYNASAGTLTFSVADLGATPALVNIANVEWVSITLELRKQGDIGQ